MAFVHTTDRTFGKSWREQFEIPENSRKSENPRLRSQRLYWASGPLSAHLNHWNILSGTMVYQKISNNRKERALYLLLERGWDIDRITDALGVLSKSIEHWEENYEVHGCVSPPKLIMRCSRLLSANMIDDIQQLLQEDPSLLLDEIVEWLALYHDQPILTTALHDNLWDLSLTCKCLKQAAAKRDNAYWTKWIVNMTMNYMADQLVFLDKSSNNDHVVLWWYGCALSGQDAVQHIPLNWGVQYSILPALSLDGSMAVRLIKGSIDGAEFYDFVVNEVVSHICSCPDAY